MPGGEGAGTGRLQQRSQPWPATHPTARGRGWRPPGPVRPPGPHARRHRRLQSADDLMVDGVGQSLQRSPRYSRRASVTCFCSAATRSDAASARARASSALSAPADPARAATPERGGAHHDSKTPPGSISRPVAQGARRAHVVPSAALTGGLTFTRVGRPAGIPRAA